MDDHHCNPSDGPFKERIILVLNYYTALRSVFPGLCVYSLIVPTEQADLAVTSLPRCHSKVRVQNSGESY